MTGLKKLIYRERLDRAIALIAQDKKKDDLVLFICDLLTAQPHEPDVSAGTKSEYVPAGIFQLEQLSSTYYLTQKDLL